MNRHVSEFTFYNQKVAIQVFVEWRGKSCGGVCDIGVSFERTDHLVLVLSQHQNRLSLATLSAVVRSYDTDFWPSYNWIHRDMWMVNNVTSVWFCSAFGEPVALKTLNISKVLVRPSNSRSMDGALFILAHRPLVSRCDAADWPHFPCLKILL